MFEKSPAHASRLRRSDVALQRLRRTHLQTVAKKIERLLARLVLNFSSEILHRLYQYIKAYQTAYFHQAGRWPLKISLQAFRNVEFFTNGSVPPKQSSTVADVWFTEEILRLVVIGSSNGCRWWPRGDSMGVYGNHVVQQVQNGLITPLSSLLNYSWKLAFGHP